MGRAMDEGIDQGVYKYKYMLCTAEASTLEKENNEI
jgi:hypothetical protein